MKNFAKSLRIPTLRSILTWMRHARNSAATTELKTGAFLHNSAKSFLFALPTELLLIIHNFLDGSGSLALAAACEEFREILRPNRTTADREAKRNFLGLLDRDEYFRTCEKERNGSQDHSPSMLACGGCQKVHKRRLFSTTQQQMPPEERKCRGLEGWVPICEHKRYGFADIVRDVESIPADDSLKIINACDKHYTHVGAFPEEVIPQVQYRLNRKRTSYSCMLAFHRKMFSLEPKGDISLRQLRKKLRASADAPQICPHWKTSGCIPIFKKTGWINGLPFGKLSRSDKESVCSICGTTFKLWLDNSDGYGVYLSVWRDLGRINQTWEPTNPTWILHVHEPPEGNSSQNQDESGFRSVIQTSGETDNVSPDRKVIGMVQDE